MGILNNASQSGQKSSLKVINGSMGPVNTLSGRPTTSRPNTLPRTLASANDGTNKRVARGTSSSYASDDDLERPSKKQRQAESRNYTQATLQILEDQPDAVDLTRPGQTRDDAIEVGSPEATTSAVPHQARDRRRQREHRRAAAAGSQTQSIAGELQPSPSTTNGQRFARRPGKLPEPIDDDDEDDLQSIQPALLAGANMRHMNGTKNELAPRGTKRGRNLVVDDEDELAQDDTAKFAKNRHGSAKNSQKHGPKANGKDDLISYPSLAITRAASGNYWHESLPTPDDRCHLVFTGTAFEPTLNGAVATDLSWARVYTRGLLKVSYGESPSPYILVERASGVDRPPKLAIEFASTYDATVFWTSIKDKIGGMPSVHIDSIPSERILRVFDNAFESARRRGEAPAVRVGVADSEPPLDLAVYETRQTRRMETRQQDKQTSSAPAPYRYTEDLDAPRKRVKDSMLSHPDASALEGDTGPVDEICANHPEEREVRELNTRSRRNRPRSPLPERRPTPPPWTVLNPTWEETWGQPLVFPPTGKNRATVDKADIPRLDEGEFLNDNLIVFYLRYLQHKLEQERKKDFDRVYFMNTWFFETVKPTSGRGGINYDGVRTWTDKVDVISYDYIVVPVHEFSHWYVAIICHPSKLLPDSDSGQQSEGDAALQNEVPHAVDSNSDPMERTGPLESPLSDSTLVAKEFRQMSIKEPTEETLLEATVIEDEARSTKQRDQPGYAISSPRRSKHFKKAAPPVRKFDPSQPRIITLDSLANPHSPTCRILRDWLVQEIKTKKNIDIETPGALGMTAKGIPEQPNHCDCGVFLLGYIQEFLKNPDQFVHTLMQKEKVTWTVESPALRNNIRDLIFALQKEQEIRLVEEKEAKRKARAQKLASQRSSNRATPTTEPEESLNTDAQGNQPTDSVVGEVGTTSSAKSAAGEASTGGAAESIPANTQEEMPEPTAAINTQTEGTDKRATAHVQAEDSETSKDDNSPTGQVVYSPSEKSGDLVRESVECADDQPNESVQQSIEHPDIQPKNIAQESVEQPDDLPRENIQESVEQPDYQTESNPVLYRSPSPTKRTEMKSTSGGYPNRLGESLDHHHDSRVSSLSSSSTSSTPPRQIPGNRNTKAVVGATSSSNSPARIRKDTSEVSLVIAEDEHSTSEASSSPDLSTPTKQVIDLDGPESPEVRVVGVVRSSPRTPKRSNFGGLMAPKSSSSTFISRPRRSGSDEHTKPIEVVLTQPVKRHSGLSAEGDTDSNEIEFVPASPRYDIPSRSSRDEFRRRSASPPARRRLGRDNESRPYRERRYALEKDHVDLTSEE